MNKKLLHITARHKSSFKVVDMYFYSIKQAKYINPYFIDFKILGYYKQGDKMKCLNSYSGECAYIPEAQNKIKCVHCNTIKTMEDL